MHLHVFVIVIKRLKQRAIPFHDLVWKEPAGMQKRNEKTFLFIQSHNLNSCVSKSIKRNKATGLDDLPPCLLKDSAAILSTPLAHLINLSTR